MPQCHDTDAIEITAKWCKPLQTTAKRTRWALLVKQPGAPGGGVAAAVQALKRCVSDVKEQGRGVRQIHAGNCKGADLLSLLSGMEFLLSEEVRSPKSEVRGEVRALSPHNEHAAADIWFSGSDTRRG